MNNNGERARYNLQNVQRVARILRTFSKHKAPLSLAALTRATGINKTTTFRIMTTFTDEGFFNYDPETKKYQFGNEFLELSANLVGGFNLRDIALPYMNVLRDKVNETVALYVRKDTDKFSIAISEGTYPVRRNVTLGERTPLHASAGGKVLLAYAPAETQRDILARLKYERFTEHTVTDRAKLEQQLQKIVEDEYAVSSEERYIGALSIASPIIDRENTVVAAINILSPVFRVEDFTEHIKLLKETANALSSALPANVDLSL